MVPPSVRPMSCWILGRTKGGDGDPALSQGTKEVELQSKNTFKDSKCLAEPSEELKLGSHCRAQFVAQHAGDTDSVHTTRRQITNQIFKMP